LQEKYFVFTTQHKGTDYSSGDGGVPLGPLNPTLMTSLCAHRFMTKF